MLSKGKVKYIHSLEMKKYRNELNAFVAEGNKLVADMMFAFECELILAKPSWMAMQGNIPAKELLEAEGDDIRKASFLKNPQDVLAVFKRPDWSLDEADPSTSLVLALDGIQDPGNLGTIIRLADWFGIEHIVCSPDTADVFSPKTVQATMGALAHVKVHYTELEDYLKAQAARQIPLFGTFLDGENMYTKELSANGIIVMGNEGNGILVARRSRSFYLARFSFRRHTGPWKSRNHHTPCRLVRHRTYRLQPRHRRCLQSEDCAGHNGRTGTCKSPLHGTGRLPESPGGKTNSVVRYIPRRRKHVHKGIVGKRNHRDGERRERNTSANRKVD